MVDPVQAELGPAAWKADVLNWLQRARRGVGVTGRYDSSTAYFWKENSWGGPLYGACHRPKAPPKEKGNGHDKKDKGGGVPVPPPLPPATEPTPPPAGG